MLLCRVAERYCAVPIEHVVETMRPLPIEAVANAPDFVLGLAIVRGVALPVVDAARLAGSASVGEPGRFVTLRIRAAGGVALGARSASSSSAAAGGTAPGGVADERHVVLAVESVVGVRHLPPSAMAELPPLLRDAAAGVVEKVGALDARLLFVLGAMHLVTDAGDA